MDHYGIVNAVRIPRRKPRNATSMRRLGNGTKKFLARIKRPLLTLKDGFAEREVFHFGINARLPHRSDKDTDIGVSVVDTTPWNGLENVTTSDTRVGKLSLDSRKSSLPTELRLKIWRMCWEPRTVEVHHYINNPKEDELAPFSTATYRSTAPLPVTLRICSESRLETLRYYTLAFAARRKPPQVYFNFNLDRLYVREADMYSGPPFDSTFPVEDLKRLQRLAVPDCYIQHLIWERQRMLPMQPMHRPLSRLLLEGGGDYRMSVKNMWESLEELDVLIDGDRWQRNDRVSSWVKEGHYACMHCTLLELRTSFKQWPGGPRVKVEAYGPRSSHLETNPSVPERISIIRREGHLIFMPCCRLHPDDLLKTLRKIDSPLNKFPFASFARVFGHRVQKCPMPCHCRLENYILSEGITTWTTRYRFHPTDGGELGKLCKKWLHDTPLRGAH